MTNNIADLSFRKTEDLKARKKALSGSSKSKPFYTDEPEALVQKEDVVTIQKVCGNCKNWLSTMSCEFYGYDKKHGGCMVELEGLAHKDICEYAISWLGPHECHLKEGSFVPVLNIRYYDKKRDPLLPDEASEDGKYVLMHGMEQRAKRLNEHGVE
jgi:hypothetical protein